MELYLNSTLHLTADLDVNLHPRNINIVAYFETYPNLLEMVQLNSICFYNDHFYKRDIMFTITNISFQILVLEPISKVWRPKSKEDFEIMIISF